MKNHSKLLYIIGLCGILVSTTACQAFFYTTDRVGIFIFNKTQSPIRFQVYDSIRWAPPEKIDSSEFSDAYDYETSIPIKLMPEVFNKIRLITAHCEVVMQRKDIDKYFIKNPEGRLGWDLYVNKKLLQALGCRH